MLTNRFQISKIRTAILALTSLALLFSIARSPHMLELQSEVKHWQEIHLPPSTLAVRSELCSTSERHFIGCYRAIRALLSLDELSHLTELVPHWNEENEALLRQKYYQHRKRAVINFVAIFNLLNREIRIHVPRKAESEAVAYALNRWLTAIDPHARLHPTSWDSEQAQGATQLVGGAGMRWKSLNGKIIVVKIRPGSAAQQNGVLVGDQILALDGVDFQLASHQRKRYLQLGEGSEKITLTLLRNKRKIEVSLAPQPTFQSNVEFALDKSIANIRIHSFQPHNTCRETGRLLIKAELRGAKQIHLDLRDNPGGLVDEARCVAGLLLGSDWRFAELHPIPRALYLLPFTEASHKTRVLKTDRAQLTALPLSITVNHNTASAAEMLAAALQDHGRATIYGTRTFGKGTMQSAIHPWGRSDLSLHYSTHLIYRASGRPLHHQGVEPNKIDLEKVKSTVHLPREENFFPHFPSRRRA